MSDRTVKVSLLVDARGFAAGMAQATAATKQLGTTFKQESETVGRGFTAIGIAAGVGVGLAVKKFGEFDQAMSFVQAATHESAANMDLLRDAALKAGATTVFSAQESANAIEELAKAGVSTASILSGGLAGALDLAAAGGLGVADAAGIAATALTQFKLEGKDVPHVADLLAAGAGKAMGSVQDLSAALNQGGLVANQTGLTIEETTGTLSAFASAGLLGSDAGTSFKTMLQRLTPISIEAKRKMQELGISAYDAEGNFVGMEKYAGILQKGLKNLSPEARNSALSVMFGSDAVRAAAVIYDNGAEGIANWIDKVDDSGYAAETAAIRLDNLAGDVEQLGGAFDTAFIKSGSAADGTLRVLTQTLTNMVTAFGDAPDVVQQTTFALGALVAVTGLAGGGMLLAVPKVVEFGAALDVLSKSKIPGVAAAAAGMISVTGKAGAALASTATFLTGPWGMALIAAAAGAIALNNAIQASKASSDEMANSLLTSAKATDFFAKAAQGTPLETYDLSLKSLAKDLKIVGERQENFWNRADNSSMSIARLSTLLRDIGKDLGTMADTNLPGAQRAFSLLAKETDGSKESLQILLNSMPDYRDALIRQANTLGLAATDQNLLKLAQEQAVPAANAAAEAAKAVAAATEDAAQASDDWVGMVSESNASFIDLKGGLDSVIAKNQAVAQSTADATSSSSDSWQDYYDGFSFQLADYLAELQAQVDAQTAWEANMVLLSGRASQGMLDELAKLGPEGAPLVASLVTASDEELAKMETLYAERTAAATGAFANTLFNSQTVIQAASAQLGEGAAAEIAAKLAAGTHTVEQIVAEYGLKIEGLRPQVKIGTEDAQKALDNFINLNGGRRIYLGTHIAGGPGGSGGQVLGSANGNMFDYQAFYNGGFASGFYNGRPGGIHKFAEPEVGWEAYISGKPGQESRNRGIALNALGRLGGIPQQSSYAPGSSRSGSTTVSVSPVVSLAGATLVMSVDGQQMTAVIKEQIMSADQSNSLTDRMGRQVR